MIEIQEKKREYPQIHTAWELDQVQRFGEQGLDLEFRESKIFLRSFGE